jgi:tetratricopeptide (TPR) repeat protein
MNFAAAIVLTAASAIPQPDITGLATAVGDTITEAYEASHAEDPESVGHYGMVLLSHHLNALAEDVFGIAVELAPEDPRWLYLHAYTSHQLGDLETAVERYDRALIRSPGDPLLGQRRASALIDLGRLDEATAALADPRIADASPASAAAMRGRIAYMTGDFQTAVRELQRALELAPGATRLHHTLGLALRRTGEIELARSHLSRAGDVAPGPADPLMVQVRALSRSVQAFIQRGLALAEGGNLEAAANQLRQALEAEPDDATAMATLASILTQMDRNDEAATILERSIATNPDYAPAYFRLGVVRANTGRLDEALDLYQRAIEIRPTLTQARYQIGATLMAQGRADEAAAVFRDLAAQYSDNLFIENQHVVALLASDDCEALPVAHAALARNPRRVDVLRLYLRAAAACATDPGVIDVAIQRAQRLAAAQPSAQSLETHGLALAAAGRDDEARAVFQAALDMEPESAWADALRDRLDGLDSGDGVGEPLPLGHPMRVVAGSEARP